MENVILFHRSFITEIVYRKIVFIVNYGNYIDIKIQGWAFQPKEIVANKSLKVSLNPLL